MSRFEELRRREATDTAVLYAFDLIEHGWRGSAQSPAYRPLAIISVLAGIALGLRYKVLILVPAVTLAMIFAMIIGVARVDHFWSIVLAMVVLGTAVQFGYLAGIAIRAAVGSVILVPHAQAALTGHPGAGGKMIEVAKVRITAAGRDALAAEGW